MSLVRLTPDSEAELVSVVAMLDARDGPCFVHGAGLGSVLPGVQVPSLNARAIMVPEEQAAEALALIADLRGPSDDGDGEPPPHAPAGCGRCWKPSYLGGLYPGVGIGNDDFRAGA
jgi:Putative prokaryotic signal transducing protein